MIKSFLQQGPGEFEPKDIVDKNGYTDVWTTENRRIRVGDIIKHGGTEYMLYMSERKDNGDFCYYFK